MSSSTTLGYLYLVKDFSHLRATGLDLSVFEPRFSKKKIE